MAYRKQEAETWQKFQLIPFHCKDNCNECNNELNNSIQDNTRCQKCRDQVNIHLSERMSLPAYLMIGIYF